VSEPGTPGAGTARSAAPAHVFELIVQLAALLREARDPDKILRACLRELHPFLGADASCVAARDPDTRAVRVRARQPADAAWNEALLGALLDDPSAHTPLGVLSARIERRGRDWGAIVVRRDGGTFTSEQRRDLMRFAGEVSGMLQRADRARLAEVRERIDTKILRDLDPKDLYYQILDGLHQLTRYDHSASLHLFDPSTGRLERVAEQIAWRKLKSGRIGESLAVPPGCAVFLAEGAIHGLDLREDGWRAWTPERAEPLARVLAPARRGAVGEGPVEPTSPEPGPAGDPPPAGAATADPPEPPVRAMLCAVLGSRADGVGVLQLSAQRPEWFGPHELDIVRRFEPAISVALHRARAAEGVRRKVVDVERRAVFAHLARGVAHDVNNALGATLPLVQQIRADLEDGRLDRATLREDLGQIERSLAVCQRIFAGMLRSARSASVRSAACDAGRAVRSACEVLSGAIRRAGVELELAIPDGLPEVRGALAELEQVVLNLATNAIEAMPQGGALRIALAPDSDVLTMTVEDTGRGIPAELLPDVEQPFVSTKENGTGLGLPTCRSILAGVGGDLAIASTPGVGTRITVTLPFASSRAGA
jgi:signal transduction histidine kinase